MCFQLYSFFFGVLFLRKTPQKIVGVVTEIKKIRGSLKVTIKSGDSTLYVSFPNNSCMPYSGDTVTILYKRYSIPLFGEHNTVTAWSRTASSMINVHNTLPKANKDSLLSRIL